MDVDSAPNPPQCIGHFEADGTPKFVGIRFCQECNNMLYPKENKREKILMYACRNCNFKQPADNPCVYVQRIVHEVDELNFIIADVAQDPTLPKQAKNCDNEECSAQEVVYFQSHSTKAEQGMRLYYVCTTCGHKWTDDDATT